MTSNSLEISPGTVRLDFDHTVFNTDDYVEWLDSVFSRQFGTLPGEFIASVDKHRQLLGNGMHMYDSAAHIFSLTGKRLEDISGVIDQVFQAEGQPDFCYPETHQQVNNLLRSGVDLELLSFGQEAWQRYKIGHCGLMRSLVAHIVEEHKADFIAREFPDTPGVLVDDLGPLALPAHWRHIWINRAEPLAVPKQVDVNTWQISSLDQLPEALSLVH